MAGINGTTLPHTLPPAPSTITTLHTPLHQCILLLLPSSASLASSRQRSSPLCSPPTLHYCTPLLSTHKLTHKTSPAMDHHQLRRLAVVLAAVCLAATAAEGFDILEILGKHDEYSQFCKLLNETHLAGDINRDRTITVLAVANGDMGDLTSGHYSLGTIRHILELHVVADYYDDKKLKQLSHAATAASTLFQRSGFAPGMAGYVNITQHRGGKVSFIVDDAADTVKPVTYVKQIESHRYDYSVLQVSGVLSSPEAEAPVAPPAPVNLTEILSKKYCKSFASLLAADPKVFDVLNGTKDTALTVFCPVDAAVAAFMPKFKNLTDKGKRNILLYHAAPDYYSMQFLKSDNGKLATLATTSMSKKDYTFEAATKDDTVSLDTSVVSSTIQATVRDDDPLAVYACSKFLQPKELYKAKGDDLAPAPAPEGPKKKSKKKPTSGSAASAPSDDDSADGPSGDDAADAADKADAAQPVSLFARWVTATVAITMALVLAA